MEIRAFAQSPEHSTLSTVNGSENGLPNPLCAADFKTSAVADKQGDADSLVARGATDWLVGAASFETPAPQAVTDATAAAQNVAFLIMSIALHSSFGPAKNGNRVGKRSCADICARSIRCTQSDSNGKRTH